MSDTPRDLVPLAHDALVDLELAYLTPRPFRLRPVYLVDIPQGDCAEYVADGWFRPAVQA
jgi:hypothetical protein